MILSNYFLWAGLFILIICGIHFLSQKKLMDKGTKFFLEILVKATMICTLGIVLTSMRGYPGLMKENLYLVLLAIRYFIQSTIPLDFFMLAAVETNTDIVKYRYRIIYAACPIIISFILNIVNIFTPVIAYLDNDYNLCKGPYFDAFFISQMIFFLIIIIYIVLCSDNLEKNRFKAMIEMNVIAILGTALQYYLQVQFIFGLALALTVLVLYITVNSPSSYMDLETKLFNTEYFKKYMNEKYLMNKPGELIVVDLYQFDSIKAVYDKVIAKDLLLKICDYVWEETKRKEVFKIGDNRLAIRLNGRTSLDKLAIRLEQFFSSNINIEGREIHCPALILKCTRMKDFENIEGGGYI